MGTPDIVYRVGKSYIISLEDDKLVKVQQLSGGLDSMGVNLCGELGGKKKISKNHPMPCNICKSFEFKKHQEKYHWFCSCNGEFVVKTNCLQLKKWKAKR
jgi:hypothetical protein